jgi:uncharacterized protein (DUF342 family)
MAETHVKSALIAKHSEITGQIQAHEKALKNLIDQLSHIEATINIFKPDYIQPQSTQALITQILKHKGITLTDTLMDKAYSNLNNILTKYAKEGHVKAHKDTRPQCWSIVKRAFEPFTKITIANKISLMTILREAKIVPLVTLN